MSHSKSAVDHDTSHESTDLPDDIHRRPIRARTTGWARRISTFLVARGVTPNQVSAAGMAAGILAGVALYLTTYETGMEAWLWVAAPVLVALRLLANMLDGMVAVEGGNISRLGELMNDAPDRVSDVAVLVGAGYAVGGSVELGLAAACVALFVAYVRVVGRASGAPSDFRGPMAKQHRMHIIIGASVVMAIAGFISLDRIIEWGPRGEWDIMAAALIVVVAGGLVTAFRRWLRIIANLRELQETDPA